MLKAVIVLMCTLVIAYAFDQSFTLSFDAVLQTVGEHPWVLFIAIAVLPGFGVPNSPLMILGGGAVAVSGNGQTAALWATVGGVIANILWTYWVAAYPLRAILRNHLAIRVPWLTWLNERSVLLITFLLHVIPGVPLFVQNYFPGVHRLAYWKYLAIAIPVQSLYTTLIVLSSGEAFTAFGSSLKVAIASIIVLWMIGKGASRACKEYVAIASRDSPSEAGLEQQPAADLDF